MTAPHIIDPGALPGQALSDASPDLMRHLLGTVINALLPADADAVCGAGYGVISAERVNQRSGYRHRELDTRAGTIDVAIPRLRQGSYFPEWLLERRKRAGAAADRCQRRLVSYWRFHARDCSPRLTPLPGRRRPDSSVRRGTVFRKPCTDRLCFDAISIPGA